MNGGTTSMVRCSITTTHQQVVIVGTTRWHVVLRSGSHRCLSLIPQLFELLRGETLSASG